MKISPREACYVCHEETYHRSPCECKAFIHVSCLHEIWQINRETNCSICKTQFTQIIIQVEPLTRILQPSLRVSPSQQVIREIIDKSAKVIALLNICWIIGVVLSHFGLIGFLDDDDDPSGWELYGPVNIVYGAIVLGVICMWCCGITTMAQRTY